MFSPAIIGLAFGAVMLVVTGGVLWAKFSFIPSIRAEYAAEITALTAAQMAKDQDAAIRAVEASSMAAIARTNVVTLTRERIIRAPATTACASSPSVAAALDGLRAWPAGPGAPVRAGDTPGLPGAAGPAQPTVR